MKALLAFALLAILVVAGGCIEEQASNEQPSKNEDLSTRRDSIIHWDLPDIEGRTVDLGIDSVRGIFKQMLDKGGRPGPDGWVGNIRIAADSLQHPHYRELLGKEVEVKGRHIHRHCGTDEQCMGDGFHSMQDIVYFRLAK